MKDKPNILYVEDDKINALVMEKLLQSNFNITIAHSGEKAVEMASLFKYDLVLMDINLGDEHMDGTETMLQIKQMDSYKETKFFAVTSYAMPEDRQHFLEQGFDEYFSKPVDHKAIISRIENFV